MLLPTSKWQRIRITILHQQNANTKQPLQTRSGVAERNDTELNELDKLLKIQFQ